MPKIIENDDIAGIQRLIRRMAAEDGVSIFALAERTSLHPTTLYAIMKKRPGPHLRPVRRNTIKALAEGSRYQVTFDPTRRRIVLEKSEEERPHGDIEELLDALRSTLTSSSRRQFSMEEKERLVRILKAAL